MKPWWLIDYWVLDRVFQPSANWMYEKIGIEPIAVAQFFGIGAVVFTLFRYYLLYHEFSFSVGLFNHLSFSLIFLLPVFLPERLGSNGRNLRRLSLFPSRLFTIAVSVYLFLITGIAQTEFRNPISQIWRSFTGYALVPPPLYPTLLYGIISLFLWTELCFLSVDRPPPRKFASARTVNMAR